MRHKRLKGALTALLLCDLYADALNEMFLHFNESKDSENFNESLDLNADGYINIRDYTLLYYTGKAIK